MSPLVAVPVVAVIILQLHVAVLRFSLTVLQFAYPVHGNVETVPTIASPDIMSPVRTVVDISLACVDCRQFVGVMLEYSVMTVVMHCGALVANDDATRRGEHVGVMVTTRGA